MLPAKVVAGDELSDSDLELTAASDKNDDYEPSPERSVGGVRG